MHAPHPNFCRNGTWLCAGAKLLPLFFLKVFASPFENMPQVAANVALPGLLCQLFAVVYSVFWPMMHSVFRPILFNRLLNVSQVANCEEWHTGVDPGFQKGGAPLKMWLKREKRAKFYNGVRSRGPLKGPWWGPGPKPWWGSRWQSPRKLLGFCILTRLNIPILGTFSLPCLAHLKKIILKSKPILEILRRKKS